MNFKNAIFEKCVGNEEQLPTSDLPEIVFSGKSNVGKSSLINKIFSRKKLAKVGKSPGKTKTINFFVSEKIRFVDLPGYGYAKVSQNEQKRWSALVEKYFNSKRNIVQVLQILDMRHTPTALDFQMLEFLHKKIPFVIIFSKSDKLNKTEKAFRTKAFSQELKKFKNVIKIPFSSVTGEGLAEIQDIILASATDFQPSNK